jgi:hypothetical protein
MDERYRGAETKEQRKQAAAENDYNTEFIPLTDKYPGLLKTLEWWMLPRDEKALVSISELDATGAVLSLADVASIVCDDRAALDGVRAYLRGGWANVTGLFSTPETIKLSEELAWTALEELVSRQQPAGTRTE